MLCMVREQLPRRQDQSGERLQKAIRLTEFHAVCSRAIVYPRPRTVRISFRVKSLIDLSAKLTHIDVDNFSEPLERLLPDGGKSCIISLAMFFLSMPD
jgi:hypothetical protein